MSKELVVLLRCDVHKGEQVEQTVEYTWGGVHLEIDLCPEQVAVFEQQMAAWTGISRKAKRTQKKPKTGTGPLAVVNGDGTLTPAKRHSNAEQDRKRLRDKVRQFAQDKGIQQARTGYLRQESIDAWLAEHPKDAAALGRS